MSGGGGGVKQSYPMKKFDPEQSRDGKRLALILKFMKMSNGEKMKLFKNEHLHLAYGLIVHDYRVLASELLDESNAFMVHIALHGNLSARFWVNYVDIHFENANVRDNVCNSVTHNRRIGVDFIKIVIAEYPEWLDEIHWHGVVRDPQFTQEMYDQIDDILDGTIYEMCLTEPYVNEMYLNLPFLKGKPNPENSEEWSIYVRASAQTDSPDLDAIAKLYETVVHKEDGSYICPGWQCNPKCTEEFMKAHIAEHEYDCGEIAKNPSLSSGFLMHHVLHRNYDRIVSGKINTVTINALTNLIQHPNIDIYNINNIIVAINGVIDKSTGDVHNLYSSIFNRLILAMTNNPTISEEDIKNLFIILKVNTSQIFNNGYYWDDHTNIISPGMYGPLKWVEKFKEGFWGGGCTRITRKIFDDFICTPKNIKIILDELSRVCPDPDCDCNRQHMFKFGYLLVGDRSLADEKSVDQILTWIREYNKNIERLGSTTRTPVEIDWNSIICARTLDNCIFKHYSCR